MAKTISYHTNLKRVDKDRFYMVMSSKGFGFGVFTGTEVIDNAEKLSCWGLCKGSTKVSNTQFAPKKKGN